MTFNANLINQLGEFSEIIIQRQRQRIVFDLDSTTRRVFFSSLECCFADEGATQTHRGGFSAEHQMEKINVSAMCVKQSRKHTNSVFPMIFLADKL